MGNGINLTAGSPYWLLYEDLHAVSTADQIGCANYDGSTTACNKWTQGVGARYLVSNSGGGTGLVIGNNDGGNRQTTISDSYCTQCHEGDAEQFVAQNSSTINQLVAYLSTPNSAALRRQRLGCQLVVGWKRPHAVDCAQ
jgi:hypothetical protein